MKTLFWQNVKMRMVLEVAAVSVVLLAAGFAYQWLGSRRDRGRYAQGGRWISIGNGSTLYLLEEGRGGPTVIFESGIGATNLNWRHIQECVASFAATVSYDRCSLGWSSACLTLRTPSNISAELHEALQRAGVRPPYILVGHSFGGLVVRRFALLYPDEVLGLVLVDPMRCEEWAPLNAVQQREMENGRSLVRWGSCFARFGLARLVFRVLFAGSGEKGYLRSVPSHSAKSKGIAHALQRLRSEVGKMPPAVRPVVAAHWSRPAFYAGIRKHIDAIPDTVSEMQSAGAIPGIPVVVITPEFSPRLTREALKAIGNLAEQIIAPHSGHWVHLDEPQLVIEAIRSLHELCAIESTRVAE